MGDTLERKADRLSVKIVSLVERRIQGELPAYDGIEAAREIRALLIKFAAPPKRRPSTQGEG